jgi:replicative DNA helicase
VLASILLRPESLNAAQEIIGTEDFYSERHQRVYDAMRALSHIGIEIDAITVKDELAQRGTTIDAGWLVDLFNSEPSPSLLTHYANIVKRTSMQRKIALRMMSYSERARSGEPAAELLSELDHELGELMGDSRLGIRATSHDLSEVIQQAERGELAGWTTGFAQYDRECGGFYPGDLVIVGGATSSGKSILALNIAEHFAFCNRRAAFFSIEMALSQLVKRILSSRSDVSLSEVRKSGLTEEWRTRLIDTARVLGPVVDHTLELWDVRRFTPGRFRIMCKAAKARGNLALACVDFVQLMSTDDEARNKELEMASIAQSLKNTARELNIVVIAVSQLNLQWSTQQRRPTKEDLKYSSAIEQAADTVMLLHSEKGKRYQPDRLMLIVDKERNDMTTWFYLNHREGRFKFEEA